MLSETSKLEQLMNEKAAMEEELRHLDEEQKKRASQARVLCEKVIQELRKKNIEKKQAIDQLRSIIGNSEAQLDALSVSDFAPSLVKEENAEVKEAMPETNEIVTIIATEEAEETVEPNRETDEYFTIVGTEEVIETVEPNRERKKKKSF